MENFESLMRYTSVKSTNDIRTQQDLYDFFKEVQVHSNSKGRGFRISADMIKRFGNAFKFQKGRGLSEITNPNERVRRSRKVFKSYNVAKEKGFTIIDGKEEIYRTLVKRGGKQYKVWKNSKGRFTSYIDRANLIPQIQEKLKTADKKQLAAIQKILNAKNK